MENSINKRLLAATIFALAVGALMFAIIVPDVIIDDSHHASQERAVPALRIFAGVHFLIGAFLIWMTSVDMKGKKVNLGLLLITAILLACFSFILIDVAVKYHADADLYRASAFMIATVAFDFVAGLLVLYEWRFKRSQPWEHSL